VLGLDEAAVVGDGLVADTERCGDFAEASPGGEMAENFEIARRQLHRQAPAAAQAGLRAWR